MPDEHNTPAHRKPRRLIRKVLLGLLILVVLGAVLAGAAVAYLKPQTWKAYTGRNAFPIRQTDGSTKMMAWEEPTPLPAPINDQDDEINGG